VLEKETEQTAVQPNIFKAERFLGAFAPHVAGEFYHNEDGQAVLKAIFENAVNGLLSGRTVTFGFENGFSLPFPADQASLENFLAGKPSSITKEYFLDLLEKGSSVNAEYAYFMDIFSLFFIIRDELSPKISPPAKVSAILERPPLLAPVIKKESSKWSWKQLQGLGRQEQLGEIRRMITHLVFRDIRFACQLLDAFQKEPNTAFIVPRGTAHVGLIPAMQTLSQEGFPKIDLAIPRPIIMQRTPSVLILSLLYSQRFWQEIVSENELTIKRSLQENSFRKIIHNVQGKLSDSKQPYLAWLETQLSQLSNNDQEPKEIVLTQIDF